ncbi:MAG: DsbA family protein [Kiloniellaceae bacterium]
MIGLGVVAAGAAAGGAWWLKRTPQDSGMPAVPESADTAATPAPAAGDMPLFADDHILGSAEAPVTIIEYASLTCGHCASFHTDTLPEIKTQWIEPGRARLVMRHYPLDQLALRAAALSECIKGDGFFGFINVLFANQEKWAHSEDPLKTVGQYAALAGLSQDAVAACMSDDATIDRILQRQTDGRDRYAIASTPSFVVNGTPVVGNRTYEEFNTILEEAATKAS